MKKLLYFGIGLLTGAGIGAGLSYIFTKNACERRTQAAIDEMKHFYEDEAHTEVKSFVAEEQKNEESEKEFIRNDKPSITEMSSLVSGNSNNSSGFTNYHLQNNDGDKEKEIDDKIDNLKKKIKEVVEAPLPSERFAVIDHAEYVRKLDSGYSDMDYSYDPGSEEWTNENTGVTLDSSDELPFDPVIVQWNDLDQCYIVDEQLQSVYMLEQI